MPFEAGSETQKDQSRSAAQPVVPMSEASMQDFHQTQKHGGCFGMVIAMHVIAALFTVFLIVCIIYSGVRYNHTKQAASYFEHRDWWANDYLGLLVAAVISLVASVYYAACALLVPSERTTLAWGLRWGYFAYMLVIVLIGVTIFDVVYPIGNGLSNSEQESNYWNYPKVSGAGIDSRCAASLKYECSGGDWLCDADSYNDTQSACPICSDEDQAVIKTFTQTCREKINSVTFKNDWIPLVVVHPVLSFIVVVYTGILQCLTCN